MTDKELKDFAKKIVEAETVIQTDEDATKVEEAKKLIASLALKISSLEEIDILDDLIQAQLKNKFDLNKKI